MTLARPCWLRGSPAPRLPAWANPTLWALLTTEGSMTQQLAHRFGSVEVERLHESIGFADPFEIRLLPESGRGGWWRREIRLHAGGQPRLWARTAVPPQAQRLQQAVRQLGNRPLMTLLFRGNRLRAGVTRGPRYYGHDPAHGWWRLCLYCCEGEPVVLRECMPAAAR